MESLRRFWQSPKYGELKILRTGAASVDAWALPAQ